MLRIGTQTGSLINHLYSRQTIGQPEVTVGMGATMLSWSDRHPGTVVEVFKIGKAVAIKVQDDDYKRIDSNGMSESQEYEYTPNPNASISTFKQLADGSWVAVYKNPETNRWCHGSGGLLIGKRERYYDFSF